MDNFLDVKAEIASCRAAITANDLILQNESLSEEDRKYYRKLGLLLLEEEIILLKQRPGEPNTNNFIRL